jgi:hypothetical protein
MASKIKVDQIEGSTGTTVSLPSGQTLDLSSGSVTLPNTSVDLSTKVTGTLASGNLPTIPVSKGGTGLTSLGSAGQAIKVNSGGNALEFGAVAGGKVLQVQYTAMVSGFAVGSTGLIDVTGYNVSITPSATTSKVLVMANFSGYQGDYGGGFRLYRGSTFISPPTSAGNRILTHTSDYNGQTNATTTYSICILDEPSTTSATTYKIVAYAVSNTQYKVNESNTDDNNSDRPRTIATITAMEIGA